MSENEWVPWMILERLSTDHARSWGRFSPKKSKFPAMLYVERDSRKEGLIAENVWQTPTIGTADVSFLGPDDLILETSWTPFPQMVNADAYLSLAWAWSASLSSKSC